MSGSSRPDRYPLLMHLRFPAVVLAVVLVVSSMTSTLASSQGTAPLGAGAYPVRGIDVSHWQGSITWSSVAADGVDFAILKATEGRKWVDPTFATNEAQAQLAGLHTGGYHVWTPSKSLDDARQEANHFVKIVCPMVNAAWFQIGSVVNNPYLGGEMARCGNIQS